MVVWIESELCDEMILFAMEVWSLFEDSIFQWTKRDTYDKFNWIGGVWNGKLHGSPWEIDGNINAADSYELDNNGWLVEHILPYEAMMNDSALDCVFIFTVHRSTILSCKNELSPVVASPGGLKWSQGCYVVTDSHHQKLVFFFSDPFCLF